MYDAKKQRGEHHGLQYADLFVEQSEHAGAENQFFDEGTDHNENKNGESIVRQRIECLRFEGCQFDMEG